MPHREVSLLLRAWVTGPLSHTPMMPPAMPLVVPLAAARALEQAGRARICHLTDPAPDRVSYLMTRRGEALSPAAQLLLEDIRTEIQRIEGVHMVQ